VLIARARCGDEHAYAELVRGHQAAARRAAFGIVRSRADAEDVTQEAFFKAYRALAGFRAGSAFRPWLLRIVTNEARNALRKSARHTRIAEVAAASTPRVSAPDEPLIDRDVLVAALARLPEEDRRAVVARYVVGLDASETANVLGVSTSTARVRVWRALQRLRREVAVFAAIAAVLAAILAASPAARAAARALLELLPGTTVVQVGELHQPDADVSPTYAGEPATVERARATLGFDVRLLDGQPSAIWLRNDVQDGMVTLMYGDVSVTEWLALGTAADFEVIGDEVKRVRLSGVTAIWVGGRGRAVYTFTGADGLPHREALAVEKPVLLWQRHGIAFRLTGATSVGRAIRAARQL
jgi:RNA polymerase sigma factor (sigma-70 family)